MPKIFIQAYPAKFTSSPTARCMQWWPCRPALAAETVDCKNAAELTAACEAIAAKVDAGQSFFVSQRIHRGERAFSGYRQIPCTIIERDRDS